jgi:hypothetical protein
VIANGAEAVALASSRQMTAPDDEQEHTSTVLLLDESGCGV